MTVTEMVMNFVRGLDSTMWNQDDDGHLVYGGITIRMSEVQTSVNVYAPNFVCSSEDPEDIHWYLTVQSYQGQEVPPF